MTHPTPQSITVSHVTPAADDNIAALLTISYADGRVCAHTLTADDLTDLYRQVHITRDIDTVLAEAQRGVRYLAGSV